MYMIEDARCKMCLEAQDTLEHRLWCCKVTQPLRDKWFTKQQWRWLAPCDPKDYANEVEDMRKHLAAKGLVRHPAVGQPLPAQEGSSCTGDTRLLYKSQRVATDGHCDKMFHPSLARASWAVIGITGLSSADDTTHTLAGPVWAGLPQTSAAAERVAIAAAVSTAEDYEVPSNGVEMV